MPKLQKTPDDVTAPSKYRGIYFNTASNRWIVELENHKHHPSFVAERDAAIYAEYQYRMSLNQRHNFTDMSDREISAEYKRVMELREIDMAALRSTSKQGIKKGTKSRSDYVGVIFQDGTRWTARIQHRGKSIYVASFSISKYDDAELLAARAYDRKALELYGDCARLNFPE